MNGNSMNGMNGNMSQGAMFEAIRQVSFVMDELRLFLDTHPDDEKALELYREAVKQTEACRCAFENEFYPLRASCAGKDCGWDWLSGQWIL